MLIDLCPRVLMLAFLLHRYSLMSKHNFSSELLTLLRFHCIPKAGKMTSANWLGLGQYTRHLDFLLKCLERTDKISQSHRAEFCFACFIHKLLLQRHSPTFLLLYRNRGQMMKFKINIMFNMYCTVYHME